MMIAAKVEEILIPRVSDFALSTDGGYSRDQIIFMESKIMKTLEWKVNPVTSINWVNWYI